jgi:DNA-binding HxlR family transcriptional regulator/putative sterol carrier protein
MFGSVATQRTYGDGCAIAHGLDLVGERWALLVVRELLLGPKRFTDLKRGLSNASPNVISERLRELERAGVVKRDKLPPPASARVYALTDWGRDLEETVMSLGRWAARSPSLPREAPIGADSVVLALKARFDPDAAERVRASYDLRLGEDRFRIAVSGEAIEIARGGADQPDARVDTDPGTLTAVLWNGGSLAEALRAGELRIEGDKAAVERLVRLFPLPEPAGP